MEELPVITRRTNTAADYHCTITKDHKQAIVYNRDDEPQALVFKHNTPGYAQTGRIGYRITTIAGAFIGWAFKPQQVCAMVAQRIHKV